MQKSSVVAGIDWAAELHSVCILDNDGKVIERFDVTHDNRALRVMVTRFRKAGVNKIAIERGDGPVVQVLIDAGLAVFVVPSRQIKALRTRYGSVPTVIGGGHCAKITRKPNRYGRCAGPARISWRYGCR